ncbi:MAG: caspase family protein [Fimbriimonadales bacterium]|nr:caspase family protein [Fimbriimonadales bacterium]
MQRKVALVVGVGRYRDGAIAPLRFAPNDAVKLMRALQSAGWEVHMLVNVDELFREDKDRVTQHQMFLPYSATIASPNRAALARTLQDVLSPLSSADTFLFFFSGHGFSENDHHYLAFEDTQLDDLTRTAISVNQLRELAAFKKPKTIFMLDACRNTASRDLQRRTQMSAALTRDLAVLSRETGSAIISACREGEVAYEDEKLQHGVFTYAVLEALQGQAVNNNGEVTVLSLSEYVLKRVPELARGRQTPHVLYAGSEGLVLASLGSVVPRAAQSQGCKVLIIFTPEIILNTRSVDWYLNGKLINPNYATTPDILNPSREFVLSLEPGRYNIKLCVQGAGAIRRGSRTQSGPIFGPQNPTGARYNIHFSLRVSQPSHLVRISSGVGSRDQLDVRITVDGNALKRNDRLREPDLNTFRVEFF